MQMPNRDLRRRDLRFTAHYRTVLQLRYQSAITESRRINVSFARDDFGRKPDRLGKISRDFGERRQKQIAETVAAEFAVTAKAIAEEPRDQVRIFRKCDHAVANVARRQHLQLVAQTPGTTAVVRDSDDTRQAFDPHLLIGLAD